MEYVRFCKGLQDRGTLIPEFLVPTSINQHTDFYQSLYFYSDEDKAVFDQTGSISGITHVNTDKLYFDFDSKHDLEEARKDALATVSRLGEFDISAEQMQICFSGNKGFNICVRMEEARLLPAELAEIAGKIAGDLKTFDRIIYNPSRVVRIPFTRHQTSGLFKFPLSVAELSTKTITQIKTKAGNPTKDSASYKWPAAKPNEKIFEVAAKKPEKVDVKAEVLDIDFSSKSLHWKNCKWSLLQGNFGDEPGERHNALTILAATCRGMGYDKESTYYMCKSALKKQAKRTSRDEFDKSELWENIIEQSIFGDRWNGGQYSCKTDPWLSAYCAALGEYGCKDKGEDVPCISLMDMGSQFSRYATDFEQNVIKTGIGELDDNVTLLASTLNGLLGQPGAGKTSMALNYLRNTSIANINSVFFSLDMGLPIVYAKLAQKVSGYTFHEVLELFKSDDKIKQEIKEQIDYEFKNVGFNFRSGLTVADMKRIINEQNQSTGTPTKLVVVDYLECIAGPYSDPIANTGFIANELKDLANDLSVCVLLLLQTQKHSTPTISDPLLSLKGVKGSSIIEQSCSTILTLWREGYNPETVNDDKSISFAVVKNRFGSLWRGDFAWDGVTGKIESLTEPERENLKRFKEEKKFKQVIASNASSVRSHFDGEWNAR